ncbi:Vps62-related protein [Spirochaeta cellobiosiphila]|uniref:Vps62-related protein n=1 Tax=Spirochaeta cellobiosiphila TaxID=504483 RepID=UPI000412247E|nr:Vps62-related protein [Spirochaeta cellobiosiphila]
MKKEKQFGDLILTFTDYFELRYNDSGSGAHSDGAFWHPIAPSGFYPLGSIGTSNYDNINGKRASICIKAAPGCEDAIKRPIGYDLIWADHGSGAHMDGSCWRPKAPTGYVSLGDVFVRGYNIPSLNDIMCVRKDLTDRGRIGNEIWADHGSGAKSDFTSFQIQANSETLDSEKGVFAPNTFVGNNKYSKPTDAPELNCLYLQFPVEVSSVPEVPKLSGHFMPPEYAGKTIDRIISVPFTAINDDAYSLSWKVNNSPFYQVERQISYKRELYDYNMTSVDQVVSRSITTGISESTSSSFYVHTGIKVSYSSGVACLGGEVSAEISTELGWETTDSTEEFREDTVNKQLVTPPQKSAAIWALSYSLQIVRGNGTYLANQLSFDVSSFVHDEFPD